MQAESGRSQSRFVLRSASAWPEPEKNKFHDIFVYWGTLLGRAAQGLKDGQVWPEPEKSKVHDIFVYWRPSWEWLLEA